MSMYKTFTFYALCMLFTFSLTAADTGSLSGEVLVKQRIKSKGATSQKDFIVYLIEVPSYKSAGAKIHTVDQNQMQFKPHVTVIVKGDSVVFKNSDKFKHNIFSEDACCKINKNTEVNGTLNKTINGLGAISFICNIHPEMQTYVLSLANPYFSKAELSREKVDGKSVYKGSYKIENIPVGKYKVTTWNKKLKPVDFEVEIKASQETKHNITIDK